MRFGKFVLAAALVAPMMATAATRETDNSCAKLPNYSELKAALKQSQQVDNGGLNNQMWGALVARDGKVCAVAFSGDSVDDQWLGSRVIAAQKANTANAFSVKKMPLSTAELYSGAQPGGFLYGIQASNPVNTEVAYAGSMSAFGSEKDPMVGKVIGGVNVFGGGLALYNSKGEIVGALGVSGDTSCADHNIAWRARNALKLDYVPSGVAKDKTDAIIYDITIGRSMSGFGHPTCGNKEKDVAKNLPKVSSLKKAE